MRREWKLLKTGEGPDLGLFKVRYNWRENPRNGRERKTVTLDSVDWVNVVAITRDEKVVVVRQYRFGIEDFTTEIPGGMVDPGEDPGRAAARELLEETGYSSRHWESLGSVQPNPAFLNNLCHHWIARDVEKTGDLDLGEGEDITVRLLSLEEIRHEIEIGRLRHSLALSALSRVFDLWSLG